MSIPTPPSDSQGHAAGASGHHSPARVSTQSSPGTGRQLARTVAVAALVLLLAFIIAFIVRAHREGVAQRLALDASEARPVVDVVAVQPAGRTYPLELPGQATGWYQSTIYSRVDGYVGSWSADIGDRVKQGQVLAVIDTPELDQQLNAAKAKAAASAAQEAVAKSNVSISKLTYDRWRDSPKGVVSEQEREEKQAAYEEAAARLTAAKAQTQLDEAEAGRYAALEAFKQVTAPYDGVITARHLDVGDLVSAGSSSSTQPLYSIAQSNRIRVFVDVPQKAAAEMLPGLGAVALSDQYPDRQFEGKVARSAMSIDPQTRTQRTEVDIQNPDLLLLPGMYLQVKFQLNQRGLQQVPAAAILFRSTGLQVAVVEGSGRVDFRPVTVAKDNGDTVVLATGVKAGEKVALNLSSAITPGELVTASESAESAGPRPSAAPASPETRAPAAPRHSTPSER